MRNRVVVTGMGVVSPIGDNIQDFWENLKSGKNGIDEITHFDTYKFDVKIAGQSQIQLDNYFDRKELNKLDRFSTFAIIAADQAILQSRIINDNVSKERIAAPIRPLYANDLTTSPLDTNSSGLEPADQNTT